LYFVHKSSLPVVDFIYLMLHKTKANPKDLFFITIDLK